MTFQFIYIKLLIRDKDYYIQIIKDAISSEYNVSLGCFREMTESELPLIIRLAYSEQINLFYIKMYNDL